MIKIDKTYIRLNEEYNGRKPKYGLIKDGKKYIFKYGHMNNEIEIPYIIKFWINKVINTRISDLNIIYNNSKNKILYKK